MFSFAFLADNQHLGLTEIVAPPKPSFTVVQINELETPGSFIQPKSFVLTVGAAFRDNPDGLRGHIEHLAQQGAVAVGFGISTVFGRIPDAVVDAARKNNVGLFEVSWPVPFSTILSAVHEEQHRRFTAEQEKRAYLHQQLLQAQEKLTQTATAGDIKALTRDAATTLEARVTIKDPNGLLIAEQVSRAFNAMKKTYSSSYRISSSATAGRPYTVDVTSTRTLTDEDRSLIRHYAGLAATLLSRPAHLRRIHNQLNSFALRIHLGITEKEEIYSGAVDTPVDREGFTRPIVIAAQSPRGMQAVVEGLDREASKSDRLLHVLDVDETTFLMVVRPDVTVRDVLDALGEHRDRVRIAAGSPMLLARLTLDHVNQLVSRTRTLRPGDVARANDSGLPWLRDPTVAHALAARREEIFGRLISFDAAHGTDYETTLAVFLRHGARLGEAAEALGVHRHTVRTRMAKIEKLCEIDLDNPAHFSEAYLAMTAFEDGAG